MPKTLWVVVETPGYIADAARVFSDEEREEIVAILAGDPECGDIISGTGGVRKMRYARGNRGKSAGARVVYYFHGSERLPVYLLTLFTKTDKDNLTKEEKNALAKIVEGFKALLK